MSDATIRQTDDAHTAAVTEVVRTYYDGMMTGDGASSRLRSIRVPASSAPGRVRSTG